MGPGEGCWGWWPAHWRTGPSSSGIAPQGGLGEEAGGVDAKTVGPADRQPWLEFWLHHFPALPQFPYLLKKDSPL